MIYLFHIKMHAYIYNMRQHSLGHNLGPHSKAPRDLQRGRGVQHNCLHTIFLMYTYLIRIRSRVMRGMDTNERTNEQKLCADRRSVFLFLFLNYDWMNHAWEWINYCGVGGCLKPSSVPIGFLRPHSKQILIRIRILIYRECIFKQKTEATNLI